jgi:hypothetical protein
MKRIARLIFALTLLAALTGCEHPSARLSTLQDPKYPVLRTSKIALPDSMNAPTVDLATRLAGESLKDQLRALGYGLTPAAEADFQLGFNITDKAEPVTYNETIPTMTTMTGSLGPRLVSGTMFTNQVVPETRMEDKTLLQVTLQRTQDPKVDVWSGRISADTSAMEKYRTAFFRALLERIGETTNETVPFDSDQGNPGP